MLRSNKINRSPIKWFIIIGLMAAFQQTNGKGIKLLPLSAPKVYRLLRETRNMDAVPEGRVVSQGLAAAAGFSLGLQTSLAGVFLYEIITANITEDTAVAQPVYLTQEICFGSRSARSLKEAEAIAEAYSRKEEGDSEPSAEVRNSEQRRRSRPLRNNKRHLKKRSRNANRRRRPQRINDVTSKGAIGSLATNPLTTAAATTAATGTGGTAGTNTGTGSNLASGLGLVTTMSTTTSTDDDQQPITCIVIQKRKQ